jgi:serine/threonine-protein kinase
LHAHLQVLIQVCNALRFAHSRGVLHRDLKPDNVMIGPFGEVVLVDWGIATTPGPCADVAGTPVYMAPEMLGEGAVLTEQTDVYLVGAVLCELLTGAAPHGRSTPTEIIAAVRRSSPALPESAPGELVELVRACMQAEPAKRPASVLVVRQALEDFLSHAGSLELAAQSEHRLRELQALLSTSAPDARRVFDLFSECRFGFQQALRSWPANARAERGLEVAVEGMIAFELRGGSARHAEALLRELKSPTTALTEAVAQALARVVAKD